MPTIQAQFRFYAELNDFLSSDKKGQLFIHRFAAKTAVKDVIESLGVPHGEVDLILANGVSVTFKYQVKENDVISVYPVFESYDIKSVTRLRRKPLRITRFMLDVHLGKLAKYLRLLGFDTAIDPAVTDDAAIIDRAVREKRIILTRDVGLLKHKKVTHGYWLRNTNPKLQIIEVLQRFQLKAAAKPFTRCLECNGKLVKVKKLKASDVVPDMIKNVQHIFLRCPDCYRIYWQGSHYDKLVKLVEEVLQG